MSSDKRVKEFRKTVMTFWKKDGRHDLPWRKTNDPYKILVSEVMLQQTQVSRVVTKYSDFLKKFPTAKALSKAPLSEVLKIWSGLGYNRRAKFLHQAAKAIQYSHKGIFPKTFEALKSLPGVGEYTAKAVLVFAFNHPEILIETNIRTVYTHIFFSDASQVSKIKDSLVRNIAEIAGEGQDPRTWHWALMDYGSHLKQQGIRINHKSSSYTKQSKFIGSQREVRGAILRFLGFSSTNEESLEAELEFPRERFLGALESLFKDGLIEEQNGILRLSLS